MAVDKKQNHRVVRGLVRLLDVPAETQGCDVFFTVVKMRIPNGKYRYPDVVVTCEEDADEYLIQTPCAVFEVLAESTEEVDTTEISTTGKLKKYLKIPSVQRYVFRLAVFGNQVAAREYLRGHPEPKNLSLTWFSVQSPCPTRGCARRHLEPV